MSQNNNNDSNQQADELLKTISQRLGADPNQLKNAAQSGNIQDIISGLKPSDAEKIQRVLSDKDAASKLLSSDKAQQLLKKFLGDK